MKKVFFLIFVGLLTQLSFAEVKVLMKTSEGDIELSLDDKKAPKSVRNFLDYSKDKFYSGTIFHRVIDGFMIQGGGFTEKMVQKNTKKAITNEANNGLKNRIGTIAMARTTHPNSATSQFFINLSDNAFLDYKNTSAQGIGYAVFGRVTKGMNVVNKIAKVQTKNSGIYQNVPVTPVKIISVEVIK